MFGRMGMESEFPIRSGRGQRCDRHALAAGPDGLCALCRTESLPPPRAYPTWVLGGLLAAVVLASTGVIAYRALRDVRAAPATIAGEAVPTFPTSRSATRDVVEPNAEPATAVAERASDASGASLALTAPLPPPAVATLRPARPSPPLVQSATAPRAARAAPSEAELRAALSSTPVLLYATSWCGYCRKAREFLTANGLAYQEIDADKTPGGWEKVQELGGRRAVPLVVVDGEVNAGLHPERILESVARSMERRLGISGITFRAN